ncbi:MAG: tRNA pseudouridine synthase A, partial [Bdellovibrionales bacterium]|nr:tRNA pseudouridine synthase A [Bdellovibrionales bacterium]
MPKVRLIVEYDGSKFNGWQEQPNLRTLQGEIRKALSLVLREDINWVLASGRTDAGVHARAQTVVFKCEQTPDLDRLINGVSNILKNEVSILEASLAEDNFHPIKDAIKKHYRYTIYRPAAPPVLDFGKVWHVT